MGRKHTYLNVRVVCTSQSKMKCPCRRIRGKYILVCTAVCKYVLLYAMFTDVHFFYGYISEAKTETMYLRAKGIPETTTIFSVEAAGQVHNQTNEFVYLRGISATMPTCPSKSTGANATLGPASGSTPSNCTTDRALPSSSKSGC